MITREGASTLLATESSGCALRFELGRGEARLVPGQRCKARSGKGTIELALEEGAATLSRRSPELLSLHGDVSGTLIQPGSMAGTRPLRAHVDAVLARAPSDQLR